MAHRRRGVGVGRTSTAVSSSSSSAHASISSSSSSNAATTTSALVQRKADELKAISLQNAISTLELLEVKLTEFAQKHQNEIKNDPIFRHRFLQMCAPLGIDVLSSSKQKTNIFHTLFGAATGGSNQANHKNDYYYELAVKCAEVCLATQNRNGGIMSIQEIQSILQNRKTKMRVASSNTNPSNAPPPASLEDIRIAIQQLSVLGGGFRTVELPSSSAATTTDSKHNSALTTTMVISVPTELDNDHMQILSIAQQHGSCDSGITIDELQNKTKWNSTTRVQRAMDLLLQEGMAWIDVYKGVTSYWFTSIWQQQLNVK
jgi:ESCRT-II complex subunit VPS22